MSKGKERRPASADFSSAPPAQDALAQALARVRELEIENAALREDHAAMVQLREDYLAATHNLGASEAELRAQEEELGLAAEQYRQLHLKYLDLFDHAPDGYLVVGEGGKIAEANHTAAALLGQPRERLAGRPLPGVFPPETRKAVREFLQQVFAAPAAAPPSLDIELPGRGKVLQLRGYTLSTEHFPPRTCRISLSDITLLREALRQSRLIDTVFRSLREGLLITDAAARITAVNPAFTEITGYAAEEVIGKTPALLHSGRHTRSFYQDMWATLGRTGWWAGEIWNRRKSGEIFPEWLAISTLRDERDRITGYVGIFSDFSLKKRAENDLLRLAHYDPLTSLPNRTLALDRLHQAIAMARRHQTQVGLLFIDLDRFKYVNDAFGHKEGDAVLADAAQRIVGCLRESDTVARIGGDEFVAVIGFAAGEREVMEVAHKIIAAIAPPFRVGANSHSIGASIGVALYPEDGEDEDTLLRHADAAMYAAKHEGRNSARRFTRDQRERLESEARIEGKIHGALERGEFFLVYQPQVRSHDFALAGFEALVRWRQGDGRIIPPGEFIPVAERSGLISELDRHVIELGTRQMREWLKQGVPLAPISFNLSAQEFQREGVELDVMRIIRGKGLDPSSVALEVTESGAMSDLGRTMRVLEAWRKVGIEVAIDDFGTGHSSLAYLSHFPANSLKIDKSFVQAIGRSPEDTALIETILAMADKLQLEVVAEGVETAEQFEFLKSRGCQLIQGYFFSPPVDVGQAERLMRDGRLPGPRS